MAQEQKDSVKSTLFVLAAFYLAQGVIGLSAFFFWGYAVWVLLKADRFLEAAAALMLAPLGMLYGVLRFFGWL